MFAVPAVAALRECPVYVTSRAFRVAEVSAVLVLVGLIGFRYEVGGDWSSYLGHLERGSWFTFADALVQNDPGYALLNWLVSQSGGEIWAVNSVCGLLFSVGLVAFSKHQLRPWLALLVAVPYLVIVVAMGYSRQGVAIGLSMLALVALTRDRSLLKFVLWMALAATFHKSALLLVPVAALSADRGRIWTALWIGGATALLYYLFLEDSVDSLVSGYISAEYSSQGAAIRVAMNALPAAIFLVARKRFHLTRLEQRLWTNMALLALGFVVFLVVSPSSTAVDRLALYLIPLQLFVLSRLPEAFPDTGRGVSLVAVGVIAYSAAVQFVWLNFAANADGWLPYQFYPLL